MRYSQLRDVPRVAGVSRGSLARWRVEVDEQEHAGGHDDGEEDEGGAHFE